MSVVPGDLPAETFPAAGPVTFVAGGPGQFLSFRLDGHSYALPLALVAEITPFKDLNRIPHMPRNVEGLLDHRGQVVPVMNLRSRMNLRPQDAGLSKNIVVLDLGGARPVGILVDAVESVITVAPEQVVAASPLLSGAEGAWVLGFIRLPAGIISLLDPASISATRGSQPERQAIAAESFHETLPTS